MVCIYAGCVVTGDFADLEEHALEEHGAQQGAKFVCIEPDCGKEYKTLAGRRKHHYSVHGWG